MKKTIITILAAVICAINVNAQEIDFTKNLCFNSICDSYLQYKEYIAEAKSAEPWESDYKEKMEGYADKMVLSMAELYLIGTQRHKYAFSGLDKDNPEVNEKLRGISAEILNIMKIVENFDNYSEDGKKGASLLWEEYENNIDSIEDELFALVNNK